MPEAPRDYAMPEHSDMRFTYEAFARLPKMEDDESAAAGPSARHSGACFNRLHSRSRTLQQLSGWVAGFELGVMYWHSADVGNDDDSDAENK